MLRFLEMAAEHSTPVSLELTQSWSSGMPCVESVFAQPPVVSFHTSEPLMRAALGWLRMYSAGKFCQIRRVWFSGQEDM